MKTKSPKKAPESPKQTPLDCLWLVLDSKRGTVTFPTRFLREIDWKTRGFLARIVREEKFLNETVFLPMEKVLGARICAVDSTKTFEPEQVTKTLEGLKATHVKIVFENPAVRDFFEALPQKSKVGLKAYPLIEDQP